MTKTPFAAIAAALAGIADPQARYAAAAALCPALRRFNPAFDTGVFLLAAGVVAIAAEVG